MTRRLSFRNEGKRVTGASQRGAKVQNRFLPSSGGGIQFDTSPQVGDWLEVTATGAGGETGQAMYFNDVNGNGIEFDVGFGNGGPFKVDSENDIILWAHGGELALLGGGSAIYVQSDSGGSFGSIHLAGVAGVTGGDAIQIVWDNIFRIHADHAHGAYLIIEQLPTSPSGLATNTVYSNGGVLTLAP